MQAPIFDWERLQPIFLDFGKAVAFRARNLAADFRAARNFASWKTAVTLCEEDADSVRRISHAGRARDARNFAPVGGKPFMVGKMTFSEIAEKVGISPDKVRHWAKALGIEPAKIRGVCYLEPSAVDFLGEMKSAVSSGLSPQAAVALLRSKPEVTVPVSISAARVPDEVRQELAELRAAVLAMAEEIAVLRRQNQTTQKEPRAEFREFYASFFQPAPKVLETCRDRYYHAPLMLAGPSNVVPIFTEKR